MELREEKKKFRGLVTERKNQTSEDECREMSAKIHEKIYALPEYQNAKTVFTYMDMPKEVEMRPFIERCWADGKTVAVPKVVKGRRMIFYKIDSFDCLAPGAMGIYEPVSEKCEDLDCAENALMIMPGVAFDKNRHRIGYGGGYYDRYLAAHKEHPTVAVCYHFQVFDEIPHDETDILPEKVLTDI